MIAEIESLVGCVEDDGVFGKAFGVEIVQQPADIVVYRRNTTQIVLYIPLIFPANKFLAFEFCFCERLVLGFVSLVPCLELFVVEAEGLVNDVERAAFGLDVDARDVLADQPERDELPVAREE